jgi:hypothetical protein
MAKSEKPALKYIVEAGHQKPCHFFASSVASWRTDADLDKLVAWMKKGGYPFNLWKVPLPAAASYSISNYAPVAEGCTFIGFWGFED